MDRPSARKVRLKVDGTQKAAGLAEGRRVEEDACSSNQGGPQQQQDTAGGHISRLFECRCQKRGDNTGYDGFRHVAGTKKLHAAVDSAGFPVALAVGPANRHESTRLIDVMEDDVLKNTDSDDGTSRIRQVHADTGYNTETIRGYLRARMMEYCTIPRKKKKSDGKSHNGKGRRDAVRYVVERFFSWPKNGFARLRIRHGRRSENCPAFANIASLMMYFRVLG